MNDIIDITLRTRTLILLNRNYLTLNDTQKIDLQATTVEELRKSATLLKDEQTALSLNTSTLSKE